jgi:hypothetical protein
VTIAAVSYSLIANNNRVEGKPGTETRDSRGVEVMALRCDTLTRFIVIPERRIVFVRDCAKALIEFELGKSSLDNELQPTVL